VVGGDGTMMASAQGGMRVAWRISRRTSSVKARGRSNKADFPPAPPGVDRGAAREELKRRLSGAKDLHVDEQTIEWYLKDRRYDVEEAEGKIRDTYKWRKSIGDVQEPDVAEEMATGKTLVHEHKDIHGRSVLLVNARKHVVGEFTSRQSQSLLKYSIDKAIDSLDEEAETLLGVFDLNGFGPKNADLDYVVFLVDAFFKYYPRRIGEVLLVDAPLIFRPTWMIAKPMLGKYAKLVKFVSLQEAKTYFPEGKVPPSLSR